MDAFSAALPDSWDTQSILAVVAAIGSLLVALVGSTSAYFRDKMMAAEQQESERRFEAFKKELQDKQRRLIRFENVQELMKQYKKPLLLSAFDLQARIANQLRQNFLYVFTKERNSERDAHYARYNFAFVIAEFLGWMEIIRQEIVFITGQEDSHILSKLLDDIKFQFTGETEFQGVAPKGKDPNDPEYDKNGMVLQLYAGELRAIGEVMIMQKLGAEEDGSQANLCIMGFAEFVQRMTQEAPGAQASRKCHDTWSKSKEKLMQDTLWPLMHHIDELSHLDNSSTPTRRLAMLQVLLCKLIDVLDNAVPYEAGPKYDLATGEEPQYIPRDFRLTPLVSKLNLSQRRWLGVQIYMREADAHISNSSWLNHMDCLPAEEQFYRLVAFPGFREDLASLEQDEREAKMGRDAWPGCCPPKNKRARTHEWWTRLDKVQYDYYFAQYSREHPGCLPPVAFAEHGHISQKVQSMGLFNGLLMKRRSSSIAVLPFSHPHTVKHTTQAKAPRSNPSPAAGATNDSKQAVRFSNYNIPNLVDPTPQLARAETLNRGGASRPGSRYGKRPVQQEPANGSAGTASAAAVPRQSAAPAASVDLPDTPMAADFIQPFKPDKEGSPYVSQDAPAGSTDDDSSMLMHDEQQYAGDAAGQLALGTRGSFQLAASSGSDHSDSRVRDVALLDSRTPTPTADEAEQ